MKNITEIFIDKLRDEGHPREQVYTDYVLIERAIEILQEFEVELLNEQNGYKQVSEKQEIAY